MAKRKQGGPMQDPSPNPPTPPAGTPNAGAKGSERTVWIYTVYVAAALVLLGLLAYHFSNYILK